MAWRTTRSRIAIREGTLSLVKCGTIVGIMRVYVHQ